MPQTYSTQAIVLGRRADRGFDNRVSLYTVDRGRVDLVVKGARRLSSRLAAHLEPFNLLEVMVVSGRRAYAGGAVSRNCYPGLKADFDKLEAAGYALRRLNRLLKEDEPDEPLFYLLSDFLALLDHVTAEPDWYRWLARIFLFKALHHLGFGFDPTAGITAEDKKYLDQVNAASFYDAVKSPPPRRRLISLSRLLERWIEYTVEQ